MAQGTRDLARLIPLVMASPELGGYVKAWRLARAGKLPVVQLGRALYVDQGELDAFVEAQRVAAGGER